MRRIIWFFRRRTPEPGGPICRSCECTLTVCPRCAGAWRGAACSCRLGSVCPRCTRHWR